MCKGVWGWCGGEWERAACRQRSAAGRPGRALPPAAPRLRLPAVPRSHSPHSQLQRPSARVRRSGRAAPHSQRILAPNTESCRLPSLRSTLSHHAPRSLTRSTRSPCSPCRCRAGSRSAPSCARWWRRAAGRARRRPSRCLHGRWWGWEGKRGGAVGGGTWPSSWAGGAGSAGPPPAAAARLLSSRWPALRRGCPKQRTVGNGVPQQLTDHLHSAAPQLGRAARPGQQARTHCVLSAEAGAVVLVRVHASVHAVLAARRLLARGLRQHLLAQRAAGVAGEGGAQGGQRHAGRQLQHTGGGPGGSSSSSARAAAAAAAATTCTVHSPAATRRCPHPRPHRASRSCAVSCSLERVASLTFCCSVPEASNANTSVLSARLVVNPSGASFCRAALRTTPPPPSSPSAPSPSLSAVRLRMLPRFLRLAKPAAGAADAASLAAWFKQTGGHRSEQRSPQQAAGGGGGRQRRRQWREQAWRCCRTRNAIENHPAVCIRPPSAPPEPPVTAPRARRLQRLLQPPWLLWKDRYALSEVFASRRLQRGGLGSESGTAAVYAELGARWPSLWVFATVIRGVPEASGALVRHLTPRVRTRDGSRVRTCRALLRLLNSAQQS